MNFWDPKGFKTTRPGGDKWFQADANVLATYFENMLDQGRKVSYVTTQMAHLQSCLSGCIENGWIEHPCGYSWKLSDSAKRNLTVAEASNKSSYKKGLPQKYMPQEEFKLLLEVIPQDSKSKVVKSPRCVSSETRLLHGDEGSRDII